MTFMKNILKNLCHKNKRPGIADDNQAWQNPQAFARQIRLFEVGGRYTLLDVAPTASRNAEGGRIAGWLYPLQPSE
jgi:hypothetical protein